MNNCNAQILAKLASREAHVAVIGLGYVGLPLAVVFAEAGYCVTGVDLDARKVVAVNKGESYIDDVKSRSLKELDERRGACSQVFPNPAAYLRIEILTQYCRYWRLREQAGRVQPKQPNWLATS